MLDRTKNPVTKIDQAEFRQDAGAYTSAVILAITLALILISWFSDDFAAVMMLDGGLYR